MVTSAPSRSSARKCVSTRRRPITSPPGGGRLTRPKRASIGPASRIDARIRAHSLGSSSRGSAPAVFTSTAFDDVHATVAPSSASDSSMLATRLPRLALPPHPSLHLDVAIVAGAPLVLVGLLLGPGIELVSRPLLRALAPVIALAIGCIGAVLGARCEWRVLRRIPRGAW